MTESVNKGDLIKHIADSAEVTQVKAAEMVNAFIDFATNSLKKGKSVVLIGFGSFTTAMRKPRKGRNPQTGKEIHIAGGRVVKFKVGKNLKDKVAL